MYNKIRQIRNERLPDRIRIWHKHNCGLIIGCKCKKEDLEEMRDIPEVSLNDILRLIKKRNNYKRGRSVLLDFMKEEVLEIKVYDVNAKEETFVDGVLTSSRDKAKLIGNIVIDLTKSIEDQSKEVLEGILQLIK